MSHPGPRFFHRCIHRCAMGLYTRRRRRRRRLEAVLLLLQRKRERRRTGRLKGTTTTSKKGGKKERKRTPACPARPGSCRCCCLITRRLFTATHARTTGRHVFIQQLQMTKESAAASLRQGKNFISYPLPNTKLRESFRIWHLFYSFLRRR